MMFTFTVKVAFMAKLNMSNSIIIVAFVAEINIKIVHDVIQVDVTRVDVIVIAECGRCEHGDVMTTSRTSEEGAAGLLLALPSTAVEEEEEEMPCVGSLLLGLPLLQLPQEQQPFSQGIVVVNNKGKEGEGGKDDPEVPGRGSLLLSDKKNKREWCTTRAHNKIKNKSKKTKNQKLNVKIVDSRKEPVVFVGGVIPTPHSHPTPPVVHRWDLPAWGRGR